MTPPRPRLPPLPTALPAPPEWGVRRPRPCGGLDASVQQQLAHCLCDLIRRMRALPCVDAQENSHDRDADGHKSTETHRAKLAYVSIRQSTPGQPRSTLLGSPAVPAGRAGGGAWLARGCRSSTNGQEWCPGGSALAANISEPSAVWALLASSSRGAARGAQLLGLVSLAGIGRHLWRHQCRGGVRLRPLSPTTADCSGWPGCGASGTRCIGGCMRANATRPSGAFCLPFPAGLEQ